MPQNKVISAEVELTPKHVFQIVKALRQYNRVDVQGNYLPYRYHTSHSNKKKPAQKSIHIHMQKIQEYTQIYRTLHSLHMGLGNSLERLYEMEEGAIPPLIKACLDMVCYHNTMQNIPMHECFAKQRAEHWAIVRLAFALCGCSIQAVRTQGLRWSRLRPTKNAALYTEKQGEEIPISIRIPTHKATHHVCTSYSCSGLENIAMGFVEVGTTNIIEKMTFAYYSHQRLYVLPIIESHFFIGKPHPVPQQTLEAFTKHMLYQFEVIENTMNIIHINYVTEALISLLSPPRKVITP